MQIGLLGKTNVGKSTFFSAATEAPVSIGNFPFTTIKPNVGVAYVITDCACKHFGVDEFDQWFKQILAREWPKLSKEIEQKKTKLVDGISKRFSGLAIKDYQVQKVLQNLDLLTKKPTEWQDSDLTLFVKELRKKTKPILIAANKADLCKDLTIVDKIKKDSLIQICSAETELLLRKATKAGLIDYIPGDKGFTIKENVEVSSQQQKALDLAKSVISKIDSTGIQAVLNSIIFDVLKLIVVYPVEDDTKLCNKDGEILPDARLLPINSNAKDLAGTVHADLALEFIGKSLAS